MAHSLSRSPAKESSSPYELRQNLVEKSNLLHSKSSLLHLGHTSRTTVNVAFERFSKVKFVFMGKQNSYAAIMRRHYAILCYDKVLDESRSFFRVHTGYFSNIPKCIKAEFIASWACSQSSVVSSSKR
ncbi:hypothetical protein TNCV_2611361 [Trichonephila clavipes]|nr:hypothetical protein TNCV_2611361 [Trichonephila clavipes]